MNILIKTNVFTGNRRCQFEHRNRVYYAFQHKDPSWTAIYTDHPNVMIGNWQKYSQDTPIKKMINEFMMTANTFSEVNTKGGQIVK